MSFLFFHFFASRDAWSLLPMVLLIFLLCFVSVVEAQDSVRGLFGTDEDFSIFYDRLEADISSEDGSRSLVVLGNVVLAGRGFTLRADAVGIFLEGVDPETIIESAVAVAEIEKQAEQEQAALVSSGTEIDSAVQKLIPQHRN